MKNITNLCRMGRNISVVIAVAVATCGFTGCNQRNNNVHEGEDLADHEGLADHEYRFPNDHGQRDMLYAKADSLSKITIEDGLIAFDELGTKDYDKDIEALVNIYNCCMIDYGIRSICEELLVYEYDFPNTSPMLVTKRFVTDEGLRKAAQEYVDSCTTFMRAPEGSAVNPSQCEKHFMKIVSQYYHESDIKLITEDEFYEQYDFSKTVKDHDELAAITDEDSVAIAALAARRDTCTNYDEKLLLTIELMRLGFDDGPEKITSLLENQQYSMWLPYAWRAWRYSYQLYYVGMSRFSEIHNETYNYMRKHIALILIREAIMHPGDLMPRALFSTASETPNYTRFEYTQEGDIVPGNSAFVEPLRMGWVE